MSKIKRVNTERVIKRVISFCICCFVLGGIVGYNVGQIAAQGKNEPNKPIETEQDKQEQTVEPLIEQLIQPEPEEEQLFNIGNYMLTAYCPCNKCCGKTDGITATGAKAMQGTTIAVDPNVIPYGTEVIINGHTYIAQDCGGAIKGQKIDIYFDSHADALKFGRQSADVFVKG